MNIVGAVQVFTVPFFHLVVCVKFYMMKCQGKVVPKNMNGITWGPSWVLHEYSLSE